MRTVLFVVAAVSCWLATPQALCACTCGPTLSPLEVLKLVDVVFTGTVIEINEQAVEIESGSDRIEVPFFNEVKFKVDRSWKGIDGDETIVLTHTESESCGYGFRLGEVYLVYGGFGGSIQSLVGGEGARFVSSYPVEEFLETHSCSRTKSLSTAQEEITILDGATAVMPSLWGQIKALFMEI